MKRVELLLLSMVASKSIQYHQLFSERIVLQMTTLKTYEVENSFRLNRGYLTLLENNLTFFFRLFLNHLSHHLGLKKFSIG
jgi:hypothetical protein